MTTIDIRTNHTGSTGFSSGYYNYAGTGAAGGAGGVGYVMAVNTYDNYAQITGGSGGAGVDISSGMLVNEEGVGITGGTGGNGGEGGKVGGGIGGEGGAGVSISAGTVTNYGTITGGHGGNGGGGAELHGKYGNGGAGVYLDGGILKNAGTISGGAAVTTRGHFSGTPGDAVQFGSAVGTLYVDPGAMFSGNVVANSSVDDTLVLTGTQSGGTGITLGTQFTGFQTLDFYSGAQWTVDVGAGAATSHTLGIEGFASGDTIDITNQDPTQVADDFGATATGSGTLVFKGSDNPTFTYASDGTATFTSDFSGKYFILTANGQGTDVTISDTPCFRRGTHILSECGEVTAESLKIGDRVATLSGVMRPIRWIGRRNYSGEATTGDSRVLPIRIRAGALGEALPKRDLWVSPEHAMYVDGMLIPAAALVNGESIIQEDAVDELTYIHLEFDGHTVIFAEGAPSESFVDDDSRQMFDNAAEYARLYPDSTREPVRFCAPRVEQGWELEAVRQRLERRASAMRPSVDGLIMRSTEGIETLAIA
jgi:Hint domain